MAESGDRNSTERVRRHRARMRARGLRLVQLWVPDTRSPEFKKEARRQSLAAARSKQEKEDMDFIEAISSPCWNDK